MQYYFIEGIQYLFFFSVHDLRMVQFSLNKPFEGGRNLTLQFN
jgi:hypothetical protein